MKLAEIKPNPTLDDALKALDALREKIVSGEVIAFCAVGIEKDDCTSWWIGCSRKVTWLKIRGALTTLLFEAMNDK